MRYRIVGRLRHFRDSAKNEFASGADPWLVAYACAYNCSVVTQEVYKPETQRTVPIPNVCIEFNVGLIPLIC
ncbi:MAG: DUF4411 family protein [Firmicutes bacterium]|nr:DUF4411 family protein [Bacillota bacterium]